MRISGVASLRQIRWPLGPPGAREVFMSSSLADTAFSNAPSVAICLFLEPVWLMIAVARAPASEQISAIVSRA